MKRRILVVEDNEINRELLRDWLEAEGFEVLVAADLKAGFTAVEKELPHAVLLDVQLGAEDGLALAASMKQKPKLRHIPVIAVTAHALAVDQVRILKAGCRACLSKPVDFKLLREQLQRWSARSERVPLP